MPVCGEAAGVAKQMWQDINSKHRTPSDGRPDCIAYWTATGMMIMMIIRLVAKLVEYADAQSNKDKGKRR